MTQRQKKMLTRTAYAAHEAGHIVGACSLNLPVSARIRESNVACGRAGAMSHHRGGTILDDVFIIMAGIAASKYFGLGEAALTQDFRDLDALVSVEQRPTEAADWFVRTHATTLRKMAFALSETGTLSEETTRGIFRGSIEVTVPQDFLVALEEIPRWEWVRKI
jgi:hypothetical protein